MMPATEQARRWRLILGRYADTVLPAGQVLGRRDCDIDLALGFLADRAYAERGHRHGAGLGGSALTAVTWLEQARRLFPKSTFERLQTTAILDYGLNELLADPAVADSIDPSPELAAALLALRGKLDPGLETGLRIIIAKVVQQIVERVRPKFTAALSGRRDRHRRSFQPRAQNLDWRATIRANLRNWDPERRQLVIAQARFIQRAKRHLPWEVILCVDQSASMAECVLNSAVCASILAALPSVGVSLVLFDTSVADLTDQAADPLEVLMTAQLGGGTNIGGALAYCETLVRRPATTALVLVSDFEEGGSVAALVASAKRLREAGVTLLGMAPCDQAGRPSFDRHVGGRLAEAGFEIAAFTPDAMADWLAEVLS
ncbi:MAG: VWA domain-containing protein [Bifidobacteriaceae bacterium]|jgi:Mg-chelatase subunit ChlD|nr:VWA domain-containing protein [Bifidobacteriaceae bacterium]